MKEHVLWRELWNADGHRWLDPLPRGWAASALTPENKTVILIWLTPGQIWIHYSLLGWWVYRISSIRCCGYYFFRCSFCAATIWGQCRTTRTALVLIRWPSSEIIHIRVCVPRILLAGTIQGWRLFRSELPIVQLLFEGGVYLTKYGSSCGCYTLLFSP